MPNASMVVEQLIRDMGADNNAVWTPTHEQNANLVGAVQQMLDSGWEASDEDIDLIAAGDQDEAEAKFSAMRGYKELNQVLGEVFEGEAKPSGRMASLNGLKTADAQNDTQLRPFSKNDWYGFAGAEKFADGSEPLIAWVDFTQWPDESFQGHESGPIDGGAVIVDGNQISVSGNNAAFVKDTSGDKEADIALGNKIVAGAPINYHDLVRMGFEPINFGNDEELRNDTGEEGRVPMNASAKVAGPFDLTNSPSDYSKGAPSNQGPDDDEPAPDEETTESIISHLNAVLQDGSMTQEDRLLRAYAELGQFLENREMISGHVASKIADSRELFDKFVSRKPSTWDQTKKVDWNSFHDDQKAAIEGLPIVEIPSGVEPMDSDIDKFFPQDKGDEGRGVEYRVETPDGRVFYVNTEGYSYARYVFEILNYSDFPEPAASTEGRVPMNASQKTAGDYAYKTELTTPDGYEIQSYVPYGDPGQARRFTVWPPKGNAVGDYTSMEEATAAIEQWKQVGDPELLKRDGGARFQLGEANFGQRHPQASDKSAARMNVERPEQAFQDNPDKYLVHVASQALEGLVGGKIKYTDHKAAEAALAKLLREGGIQPTEFTQLGYDDVSFEVADQAAAIKATDYLNGKLPKSSEAGGYGYGTAEPAQAASYRQTSDQQEGDEYSDPGGWVYPESTL